MTFTLYQRKNNVVFTNNGVVHWYEVNVTSFLPCIIINSLILFHCAVQQQNIPAIRGRSFSTSNAQASSQQQEDEDNNPIISLFKLCCLLCFLPCVFNSK